MYIYIYIYIYPHQLLVAWTDGWMDRRIDVSDITVEYMDWWMLGWCYLLILRFGRKNGKL